MELLVLNLYTTTVAHLMLVRSFLHSQQFTVLVEVLHLPGHHMVT